MINISLTTDFGNSDFYLAALKATLLKNIPQANLLDISHHVPSFDLLHGALLLQNVWPIFPKKSIHLVAINTTVKNTHSCLIIAHDQHFFVGPDNGFFTLLFGKIPENTFVFTFPETTASLSLDVYVQAIKNISENFDVSKIGLKTQQIVEKYLPLAVTNPNYILGTILHVDKYGNLWSNIQLNEFNQFVGDRTFTIFSRFERYRLKKIRQSYYEVDEGEAVARFNSAGWLEIAINGASATQLLGLQRNDHIRIEIET